MKNATLCLVLTFSLFLAGCHTQVAPTTNTVKEAFEKHFENRPVQSVSTTPVSGIYEIVLQNKQIIYVDKNVNYLFVGNLLDIKAQKSLTEERQAQINRVDWSRLPLADAIKEVRGNGSRQLAIFTDPDCPYCKKLEKESLADMKDITIYTFLYPLSALHPQAEKHAKQIWCAKDRTAVWIAHMRFGKATSGSSNCPNPIERNVKLGESLGINSTPTLVFADGRIIPGAVSKEELEKLLEPTEDKTSH